MIFVIGIVLVIVLEPVGGRAQSDDGSAPLEVVVQVLHLIGIR